MYILGNKIKQIEQLYNNILYITYKLDFEKLENTDITSDIGWGCTIRSSQMMLSNVLLYKKFGLNIEKNEDYYYILYLFKDNYKSYFSFHNYIKNYKYYNKKICEWIGPYTVCSMIEKFCNILDNKFDIIYNHNLLERKNLKKYFTKDKSYLLTFSLKLGINYIDKIYYIDIIELIKNNNFKGIIGGNEQSSYYFIGINNDFKLIYLDPHNPSVYKEDLYDDKDYYTNKFNYLNLNDLSPSLSFCFYFKNYNEMDYFYKNIKKDNILNIVEDNNIDNITTKKDNDWEVIDL